MSVALKILKETKPFWHDGRLTKMLGCTSCYNHDLCGGLNVAAGHFSCRDLCTCKPKEQCNFVCPSRPVSYVRYLKEVGGLGLETIPRTQATILEDMPPSVPMVYGHSARTEPLRATWVALPLAAFFYKRNGQIKFGSVQEVCDAFLIEPGSRWIISGVDFDQSIERYWRSARGSSFIADLAKLKPALVTTPNFSLFVDAPREDNLHNIKRIAICWQELLAAGIPTSLHVNARTDSDWKRWTDFIGERPEVNAISFEFGTGAKYVERGQWHAERLCKLRADVGRELHLTIRGTRFIEILQESFSRLTLIDTSLYMKSVRRQKLVAEVGAIPRWERSWSLVGEPLDRMFNENIDATVNLALDPKGGR
jgi:hypothetical protein